MPMQNARAKTSEEFMAGKVSRNRPASRPQNSGHALFVAEGGHGVESHGAPSREITSKDCGEQQDS